ncbi:trans-aconitate 3-methyltransferase [Saccharomycopsis crataegensis]|uniref:Trans-aconitate 3-methyltransferase n=1 Tax=Saccharomycopsis crataegensis TaxID=43959 RepID=A0AAV5QJ69_9ASCO|nr:trans-aconitate 3-methyltransferase [Saccharomycopsis crataegensis]
MTEYSTESFSTNQYDLARPTYPLSFIQYVVDWHKKSSPETSLGVTVSVDIGCGTGQVTFPLYEEIQYADNVYGVDPSAVMIQKCQDTQNSKDHSTITKGELCFKQAAAEKLDDVFPLESVDLLTGAECFHWFKHQEFFEVAHKILKPHGTLAYWFYVDPVVISVTKPDGTVVDVDKKVYMEIYDKYTYGEEYFGPYWEQPGRNHLRTFCKDVKIPTDLFKDIETHKYRPVVQGDVPDEKLKIERSWTLQDYKNYQESWSAYHKYVEETKKASPGINSAKDIKNYIPNEFSAEMTQRLGINPVDKMKVIWSTIYFLAKKR